MPSISSSLSGSAHAIKLVGGPAGASVTSSGRST